MTNDPANPPDVAKTGEPGQYLVVARRYRPRSFQELVGQEPVSHALGNAINSNRVGHAYLFTGARGVGKTSAARIFAKSLNCQQGPSPTPDNSCDICQGIDAGEDIDVLEIDGASNRGIEEIRQLRSNVHIRPSRAKYKIYIIDEVHMLTTAAFNALLKTLEEPPEHVKFIFCTTDPEKIPITVLSRCQRYDFAPIDSDEILSRLRFILNQEGRDAEDAALAILARRAAGSMRDSQSLLEQLLAFAGQKITAQDVNQMLGAADNSTLEALVDQLLARDPAGALGALEKANRQGIDAGHLTEQLLAFFRDMLVASVGAPSSLALQADYESWSELAARGQSVGAETLLAICQILDHTLIRMRQSTHGRVLLELALLRIASLGQLEELAQIVDALRQGVAPPAAPRLERGPLAAPAAQKKTLELNPELPVPSPPALQAAADVPAAAPAAPEPARQAAAAPLAHQETADQTYRVDASSTPAPLGLTSANVERIWAQMLERLGEFTADTAARAERVAISAPNRLVVYFSARYNLARERCERSGCKSQIEHTLQQIAGVPVSVQFERIEGSESEAVASPSPVISTRQRLRDTERHELVIRAKELFGAEVVRVDPPRKPTES